MNTVRTRFNTRSKTFLFFCLVLCNVSASDCDDDSIIMPGSISTTKSTSFIPDLGHEYEQEGSFSIPELRRTDAVYLDSNTVSITLDSPPNSIADYTDDTDFSNETISRDTESTCMFLDDQMDDLPFPFED